MIYSRVEINGLFGQRVGLGERKKGRNKERKKPRNKETKKETKKERKKERNKETKKQRNKERKNTERYGERRIEIERCNDIKHNDT